MINKFKTIKNIAVFKDFNWDNTVLDKSNEVIIFKKINILYGRNYSGKTTLSRVVRVLETGKISDSYSLQPIGKQNGNDQISFEIEFKDSVIISQDNWNAHNEDIRVFNKDFIKDFLNLLSKNTIEEYIENDTFAPSDDAKYFALHSENFDNITSEIEKLKQDITDNNVMHTDEISNEKIFAIGIETCEALNKLLNELLYDSCIKFEPRIQIDIMGKKNLILKIFRDNKPAYELSEGEINIIAFCYFIIKLSELKLRDKKPIIWIDDPISSLDSNNIFFIYSLISSQICKRNNYKQLFISTHNLSFLKYLHRLPSPNDKKKDRVRQFIIERKGKESTISKMPNYLEKYVTEFNYLFKQILECSQLTNITDDDYTLIYNFGNNSRKFLEIYLFYKYPDSSDYTEKKKKFFGKDDIPAILTDRINNEYSHLTGSLERGEQPIEVPEIKKAAMLIIKRIKQKDEEQYEALVRSVVDH